MAGNATTIITQTGYLPIRYEQVNSSGGTGSTSEMRAYCAAVETEGPIRFFNEKFNVNFSPTVTDTEDYLFAIRPETTFNSITNNIVAILESLNHSIVQTSDANADDRIIVRLYVELSGALATPSWTSITGSGFEYDTAATLTLTPGVTVTLLNEFYVKGTDTHPITPNIAEAYPGISRILRRADGTQTTIIATVENPETSASAEALLNFVGFLIK
jgi:hypothetical protein